MFNTVIASLKNTNDDDEEDEEKEELCKSANTYLNTLEEIHVFFSHSFLYRYIIKYNTNFSE